ncbi:hypothetical protein P170DRAFT_461770 [Aspergillus steynii IBT 23096]|uniref:Uncharacterized protein n=1 Tax=Aspergillus steynii IBT 23096 TaxID=1392250 RepID=A0A2I2GF99_9EURO|nr:uncharacterized protein P170DRAFT_461770 [Aspergillus steynii IBT 23096]PLB51558.1 hypothetical protein P170DRAFT_461770 [Aspergillus steynii IBT 23096]
MAVTESPVDFGLPGDTIPERCGVREIRDVTRILEDAGIPCCMAGASALVWFGAWRVRCDFEICVPTEKVSQAVELLKSDPHDKVYQPWKPENFQPGALTHTFPRFKLRGVSLRFQILPSDDCAFNIYDVDRSPSGLPYPKLESYAQSLLDTQRRVDLTDLIDGMNLTEEWGEEHLNLDKMTDVAYAKQKNAKILASMLPGEDPFDYPGVPAHARPLREIWQEIDRGKQKRISLELPVEYFATRFFAYGQGDPRLDTTRPHV